MKTLIGTQNDNENAVKFYEYFETEDELIIIMELYDINLINYLIKNKGKLSIEEIYEILNQLNRTFKIMNQYKLIDGMLNLENILLKFNNKENNKNKKSKVILLN